MRTILIIFSLFIAPLVRQCAAAQDTLKFYVVSDEPVPGGRYIDTAECPKVGYIGNTPNLVVRHLQAVSTNTYQVFSQYNGKVSVQTNAAIVIQMAAADETRFAGLTRENVGRCILISLGDRPLMAPRVQTPIKTGDFQISLADGRGAEATLAALKKFVRDK